MGTNALVFAILALASSHAFAADPSPLQDFCVADNTSNVFVNGVVCKDPKLAKAEDFFFFGLDMPGDDLLDSILSNTSNPLGSKVTAVNIGVLPSLNTLGISLALIDFTPYGLNPPHTHLRATEILTVLEGTLYVGFVTSNSENKIFTKVLKKGDLFIFPVGLIHFQFNIGHFEVMAIVALSSKNPSVIAIANVVFGSKPLISDDVLAKAFQLDKKVVDYLQSRFWMDNN